MLAPQRGASLVYWTFSLLLYWGTLWQHFFFLFFPLEIDASNILFHMMVYLDMVSVGTTLFFSPKSFKLFMYSFSKELSRDSNPRPPSPRCRTICTLDRSATGTSTENRSYIDSLKRSWIKSFLSEHSHLVKNKWQRPGSNPRPWAWN